MLLTCYNVQCIATCEDLDIFIEHSHVEALIDTYSTIDVDYKG